MAIDRINAGLRGEPGGVTGGPVAAAACRAGGCRAADRAGTDAAGTAGLSRGPLDLGLSGGAGGRTGCRAQHAAGLWARSAGFRRPGWSGGASDFARATRAEVEDYLIFCEAQGLSKATRARRLSVDPAVVPLCARGRLSRRQPGLADQGAGPGATAARDAVAGGGGAPCWTRRPRRGGRAIGCATAA